MQPTWCRRRPARGSSCPSTTGHPSATVEATVLGHEGCDTAEPGVDRGGRGRRGGRVEPGAERTIVVRAPARHLAGVVERGRGDRRRVGRGAVRERERRSPPPAPGPGWPSGGRRSPRRRGRSRAWPRSRWHSRASPVSPRRAPGSGRVRWSRPGARRGRGTSPQQYTWPVAMAHPSFVTDVTDVIGSGTGSCVSHRVSWVSVCPTRSVTCRVTVFSVSTVGVPVIAPVDDNDNPGGSGAADDRERVRHHAADAAHCSGDRDADRVGAVGRTEVAVVGHAGHAEQVELDGSGRQ